MSRNSDRKYRKFPAHAFHYRFRGIVAHKRDIDIAGIQREPVRTADEIGDVVEITVRPERPPAAVRQGHHDLCA